MRNRPALEALTGQPVMATQSGKLQGQRVGSACAVRLQSWGWGWWNRRQGWVFKDELGVSQAASQAAQEEGQLIQAEGTDCKDREKVCPFANLRDSRDNGSDRRGTGWPTSFPVDSHDSRSTGHMQAGKTSGHKGLC